MMKIRYMRRPGFHVETIPLLYYKGSPLENALDRLFVNVDRAYKNGANILILSDRGVDENHVAIPSLLAVSALEHYLVRTKKRTAVSLILESAEPGTCTTLPPCWATAPRPSTPTWPRSAWRSW